MAYIVQTTKPQNSLFIKRGEYHVMKLLDINENEYYKVVSTGSARHLTISRIVPNDWKMLNARVIERDENRVIIELSATIKGETTENTLA